MNVEAIGKRDRPVMIQQRVSSDDSDDSGAPTEDGQWTVLARVVLMHRQDLNGMERFQVGQLSSPFTTTWQMPYRRDMDPDRVPDFTKVRRLKYLDRIYDITSGQVLGAHEGIAVETLARQG